MKTNCELCGKETNEKVSYLEIETWEFDFLKKEKKDYYSICFECFDKHTNHFIDQDTQHESRKKRSQSVNREIQEEIEAMLGSEG
ncbi:hypothetical protein [Neobacillus kokaensis]|uniref:Uncharacterized protein n=1 Tax=Neobacillus kokaensis TaxID=2759023 RepID=A0ABQ3N3K8_9BACI|nr:hypothetical protein [Neobacillus kokaensis]GHH98719.1 hypothetical protein AM1BK_22620 [Neobacillus kokaensis]